MNIVAPCDKLTSLPPFLPIQLLYLLRLKRNDTMYVWEIYIYIFFPYLIDTRIVMNNVNCRIMSYFTSHAITSKLQAHRKWKIVCDIIISQVNKYYKSSPPMWTMARVLFFFHFLPRQVISWHKHDFLEHCIARTAKQFLIFWNLQKIMIWIFFWCKCTASYYTRST